MARNLITLGDIIMVTDVGLSGRKLEQLIQLEAQVSLKGRNVDCVPASGDDGY
jgi:hypothetical protein